MYSGDAVLLLYPVPVHYKVIFTETPAKNLPSNYSATQNPGSLVYNYAKKYQGVL